MAVGSPPGPPRSFTYSAVSDASRYTRLFSVTVTHNYYTQQKGLCRDFKADATPATASLMASLGLLLKNEGAGFSLFYTPDSLDKICSYLRREAQASDGGSGFWSRLTFLMELCNPEFVGITALPIETTSSKVNLYGCNRQAHVDDETVLLSQGPYMGGESLYPVAGSDVNLKLPRRAFKVSVTDISGATVIPAPGAPDVPIFGVPGGAKAATLDLSGLPYDLYTIVVTDRAGRRIGAPRYPLTVLYVPQGDSMALLDILFTQPEPDMGGVYPITPLFGGTPPKPKQCGNIAYRLPFDARSTYWQYYVVSEAPGGSLSDLHIRGPGAQFEQEPKPVLLPDGNSAVLFTSDTPRPLRQKSPQHFRLSGRRLDAAGHDNAIALARLPVAPGAPVWPAPEGPSTAGTSEMFVYV
jgi:hypothetical protein